MPNSDTKTKETKKDTTKKATKTTTKKSAAKKSTSLKSAAKKSSKTSAGKNLVIVESPTKASTIKKFLGSNYEVVASGGHVRDLPKSKMGIEIENDYEPDYITIRGKGDVLAMLRRKVKSAKKVYLATDPDREGEAISWHLYFALKLSEKPCSRITFNEITKNAVKESIKNAREIDQNLVDAQQARRVLDRIIGYEISPILWAKVKGKLSAGRVQSTVLKLICDREAEVNAFIPEEYWSLDAEIYEGNAKKPLVAKFSGDENGKVDIKNRQEMDAVLKALSKADLKVTSVKNGERVKKGPLPFTTSTLQQEAASKLNMSPTKTMQIAQQLYEGVNVPGHGSIGLITYLRTDSIRISDEAKATAKQIITDKYGAEYLSKEDRAAKNTKRIQDAHEAIRPSYLDVTPDSVKSALPRDLYRLYHLIYNRFFASQMSDAKYDTITVKMEAGKYKFTASASKLAFDGFLSVYDIDEEKLENNSLVSKLKVGETFKNVRYADKQHFTQPPARYSEQTIVKTMEELGIGRPSTYATTIKTILSRRYVVKDGKSLYPTELGEAVDDIMIKAFPVVVDVDFTSNIETLLDMVEEGNMAWKDIIRNNYPELHEAVVAAEKELEKVTIADEETDTICEKCGRNMVIKYGPYGKFLACPGFPECQNTKPYFDLTGVPCPNCGQEIALKRTKNGRKYFGCIGYPDCDFMSWQPVSKQKCPLCGKHMLIKGKKVQCSDEQCGFVKEKTEED